MPIQDTSSLEAKALEYLRLSSEIAKMEERKLNLKADIGQMMQLANADQYRFRLDELFDVKVTAGPRKAKIVDRQELANDLGVPESVINLEFLLKAVEDGKLTLDKFKQYCYTEYRDNVSIRKVNADN